MNNYRSVSDIVDENRRLRNEIDDLRSKLDSMPRGQKRGSKKNNLMSGRPEYNVKRLEITRSDYGNNPQCGVIVLTNGESKIQFDLDSYQIQLIEASCIHAVTGTVEEISIAAARFVESRC